MPANTCGQQAQDLQSPRKPICSLVSDFAKFPTCLISPDANQNLWANILRQKEDSNPEQCLQCIVKANPEVTEA